MLIIALELRLPRVDRIHQVAERLNHLFPENLTNEAVRDLALKCEGII